VLELGIITHPYRAHVERQLAPAAGEIFTAHFGLDAVRDEQVADQMSFERVTGCVELFQQLRSDGLKRY
jgi:hypothetical protein